VDTVYFSDLILHFKYQFAVHFTGPISDRTGIFDTANDRIGVFVGAVNPMRGSEIARAKQFE